jgi:PPOX class probable F420-dependent enzyme
MVAMTDRLALFRELASLDHGLCVVSMLRGDGSVAASVVNAGVMQHPETETGTVAFVARGLRKLEHLRADARATVVARAGWRWAAVEGTAEIFGPDDPHPDVDREALRLLLRNVFLAAGGTHDDWDTYDRTLADERSAAVFVTPLRTYPTA